MNKTRSIVVLTAIAVVGFLATAEYRIHAGGQSSGPDVIVGDLNGITSWGTSGGVSSFSVGTTSCNIGDDRLKWFAGTNEHPVIPQNIYRVKDGRIEQLGQSWLKHGFFALSQSLCGSCQGNSQGGTYLGIGCSDPYSAGLNGSQGGLGPKSEVNAATGFFVMPHHELTGSERGTHGGRVTIDNDDLDLATNAGARYFAESHYVTPDDTAAGNALNNASIRECFVSFSGGDYEINFSNSSSFQTERELPGIMAWQLVHPDVELFNVDVPGDGRIIVGLRPVGNRIEIAVQNFNSHLSVRSVKATFDSATLANPGFRDVDYHAEPYADTDWTPTINGSEVEWATETFAQNENANAIRWSTLYSFWIDADDCPSSITLGMFRPGGPSEMVVDICPTVTPDSYVVTQGTEVSGDISSLDESDDVDLSVRRAVQDVQARTMIELNGTSPFSNPGSLDVTLESSVFARTQVVQSIELYNFDSDSYEQIDSRDAARFTDATVEASATGDLSRFVESGSNAVRARIVYDSTNPRQRFTCHNDLFSWSFGL